MFVADFHIHSRYSRATSKNCNVEELDFWARRKGIHVLGTGDFTHPAWREELEEKLVPTGDGLYSLKSELRRENAAAGADFAPQFMISGEISSIYKKDGKVRKVHNLIMLPSLAAAKVLSHRLEEIGNLHSDGRPILGLDSKDLLEIVLEKCPEAIFIPAHIWTPHFSLFGANSGFDEIHECFGDLTEYIYALETGLSSDPPMNWRLSALDKFTLVSNSDAHSPAKLAREANIFNTDISYPAILAALKNPAGDAFHGTLEFFPEEGKYHFDGHRACKVCWKPSETIAANGICPVCGKKLTVGVLHRVEALADREEGFVPKNAKPFESLVPLEEIVASSIGFTVLSKKVKSKYEHLLQTLGSELFILREASLSDIELAAGPCVAEGIRRLRAGKVDIRPGFDGEFGKVKVIDKDEIETLSGQLGLGSDSLFAATETKRKTAESTRKTGSILATSASSAAATQKKQAATKKVEAEQAAAQEAAQEVALKEPPAQFPYGLNREQWEAVTAQARSVAVIAGPGTGKTKTLVSRIIYLVEQCQVSPMEIVAVTFTNKAAREMRDRLTQHFKNRATVAAMTIGTFHSICLKLLQQWRGQKKITILDEYNIRAILAELIKEMEVKLSVRNAYKAISLLKNGAAPEEKDPQTMAEVNRLSEAYCARLQDYDVMDYDDILLNVLKSVETSDSASSDQALPENFARHLLVDEFQDINEIQYRLIQGWSKNSQSLFIIGDPDQSIYGFRGSDFRYFERFGQDFSATQTVRLTKNYRSTPEIITAAEELVHPENKIRTLCPVRKQGLPVRLVTAKDEFSEAIFIAKEISRLVGGVDMLTAHSQPSGDQLKKVGRETYGFSDLAVLYRTNRQAEILEQCLITEGIPYTVRGKDEFLAEKSVRDTLAFFKFLLNPEDLVSLFACLNAYGAGTAKEKLRIMDRYKSGAKNLAVLQSLLNENPAPSENLDDAGNLTRLLQKYEKKVLAEAPEALIRSWISDQHLSEVQSMDLLLDTALTEKTMAGFLQNLALGQEGDILRSGKNYSTDAVSLMTMHAAKGLEFPVTFIYGANDGLIPLRNGTVPADPAEERRLFYVGMTRAQDELILLSSHTLSPFLTELSEGLLQKEWAFRKGQEIPYKQDSLFTL